MRVEMFLVEPDLDLAVAVGSLFPWPVSPSEVADWPAIALGDEPAVGETRARPLPAQAQDHRVLRKRGIGGGHQVRRQLGVSERGCSVSHAGHREDSR